MVAVLFLMKLAFEIRNIQCTLEIEPKTKGNKAERVAKSRVIDVTNQYNASPISEPWQVLAARSARCCPRPLIGPPVLSSNSAIAAYFKKAKPEHRELDHFWYCEVAICFQARCIEGTLLSRICISEVSEQRPDCVSTRTKICLLKLLDHHLLLYKNLSPS